MRRRLYTADHEAFREVVAEFIVREVAPNAARWDAARLIDRDVWSVAGTQGVIGLAAPEEFGGAGMRRDYRYRSVALEELAKASAASLSAGFSLQDDIVIPYIDALGSVDQKKRWLPKLVAGEAIGAIAMTEPGTGSDLRGVTTSATKVADGWLVNGGKTFITNGVHADLVITVVRTDPVGGSAGFSLLVVERGMAGFHRGRKLDKIGLHAQDTAELFFEDVFVPDENVLGAVGGGFAHLMTHLPLERLSIAANAVAATSATLALTVDYTQGREAFGRAVADFQNTQFRLADMTTELDVTRTFVDQAILAYNHGELSATDAAKAKLWATEVQGRIVDQCLQLHGGYGYMAEYPVARAFVDARVQRIFGGTNEIMRQIIGRDLVERR